MRLAPHELGVESFFLIFVFSVKIGSGESSGMPTAATAKINYDPRSRLGTNRFLSGLGIFSAPVPAALAFV
jgi:Na+/melibiose symporter-like transporter